MKLSKVEKCYIALMKLWIDEQDMYIKNCKQTVLLHKVTISTAKRLIANNNKQAALYRLNVNDVIIKYNKFRKKMGIKVISLRK